MFRPKKYVKLEPLSSPPSIDDLKRLLSQVQKIRGCTIELPWSIEPDNVSFALAVRIELGAEEPIWSFYEGTGLKSHAMWSAPFNDMSLLKEVVSLSVVETIHKDIPGGLKNSSSSSQTIDYSEPAPKIEIPYTPPYNANVETNHPNIESVKETDGFSKDSKEWLSHSYREFESAFADSSSTQNINKTEPDIKAAFPVPNPVANQSSPQPINPSQNYYPANLNDSERFPSLTSGAPSVYYYPGYPYPLPYPPMVPMPQSVANSVPLQPGTPLPDPNASTSRMPAPDVELLRKQTNFMLGQFLVDSGLIPESTLKAALKLQEMVVGNVISRSQAIETVNRIHYKGGNLDISHLMKNSPTGGNKATLPKKSYPLLGDLLVKAEVIDSSILEGILKMQEIVRAGALSKDEACQAISKELNSQKRKVSRTETEKEQRAIDLLIKAGMLLVKDKEIAYSVQKKHGGNMDQILVAAGKISDKTYQSALECEAMLFQERIKLEQAIITLNYCERSRVSFTDALEELNFQINS